MRRLAALTALLVGAVAGTAHADEVRITAEKELKPRVIELTITTPAFTKPTHALAILPAGYDAEPSRRWPVTYALAGTMNTYKTIIQLVDGVKLTERYPSIVISPNGDSGYWSDWYNGGAFGPPKYETYVVDQLIPLVDEHFRTIPRRSQRAVFGVSMGGYGAAMVAARHPDLFAAAASISGAVDSNLPANGAVLSASSTFDNAPVDAIYGPRSSQEIRWHGHNPTDLAANLRGLDLQVRSANGVPNPGIGENPTSADSVSCIVEGGVYMASVSFEAELSRLQIPHLWKDYGPGCHTKANFEREIADTLAVFTKVFASPPPAPSSFDFKAIEPAFDVYGWEIAADRARALEFLRLEKVSARGLTLVGSGTTSVVSPPLFRGLRSVDVAGGSPAVAVPAREGRIRFTVDLGPADTVQENTPGASPSEVSKAVTFAPHAVVRITRAHATRRGVRVCARAVGGSVTGRLQVTGAASTRRVVLGSSVVCRSLRWGRGGQVRGRVAVRISGRDAFGHAAGARRSIRRR